MDLMTAVAIGAGAGLVASLLLLLAAVGGWRPTITLPRARSRHAAQHRDRARIGYAVGAGLLVAVVTRWPVAACAAVALVWLWPKMFGAAKAGSAAIERLEGLATWTESMRDSIAGSVGLEEAIQHSLTAAPRAIRAPLQRLVGQLQARVPLTAALRDFADDFDDASADLVVAALVLNSKLRGPGLVGTLSALSTSAREELDLRRRVEEGRRGLRRNAVIIVVITVTFAGGLVLFSPTFVQPYSTWSGQVMLAFVLALISGGLVWMREAATTRAPERFLAGHPDSSIEGRGSSAIHAPAGGVQRTEHGVGHLEDRQLGHPVGHLVGRRAGNRVDGMRS